MSLSFRLLPTSCFATLLLASGCQSPGVSPPPASRQNAAKPNFGPPMQDVRTEATIQAMENDYIAAKNSRPTHQAEAEAAAKKKKEQEQQQKAPKAAASEKTPPADPAKDPATPASDKR